MIYIRVCFSTFFQFRMLRIYHLTNHFRTKERGRERERKREADKLTSKGETAKRKNIKKTDENKRQQKLNSN